MMIAASARLWAGGAIINLLQICRRSGRQTGNFAEGLNPAFCGNIALALVPWFQLRTTAILASNLAPHGGRFARWLRLDWLRRNPLKSLAAENEG